MFSSSQQTAAVSNKQIFSGYVQEAVFSFRKWLLRKYEAMWATETFLGTLQECSIPAWMEVVFLTTFISWHFKIFFLKDFNKPKSYWRDEHTGCPTILSTPLFLYVPEWRRKQKTELATLWNDRVQNLPPQKNYRVQNLSEFRGGELWTHDWLKRYRVVRKRGWILKGG